MPDITLHEVGGNGAPIVLLHGFAADRKAWLANQHALFSMGRVLSLDLPGHGETPLGDVPGFFDLVDQVEAVVRSVGQPAHLIGHSMGGAIAATLATRNPAQTASVTLIAPAGLSGAVNADFLADYPKAETEAEVEAVLHRLVVRPRLIGKALVASVVAQLATPGYREGLVHIGGLIADLSPQLAPIYGELAMSDIRRRIHWGAMDQISAPDAERIAAMGGEAMIHANAGHLPHVEDMNAFNKAVAEFIGQAS